MKTLNLFFATALILLCANAFAQDPLKAAPEVYRKAILDNESVRVIEIEFAIGQSAATHSHPNHFAYITQGGQLTITSADGKAQVIDAKAGEIFWMDATTHSTKNTGTTVVKAIVTELKK